MSSTSKYRRKVDEKRQTYGNGTDGCAHRLPYVEVHTGPVIRNKYINEVPKKHLPIFTDERTERPR